jgi:hypothetical protein
MGEHTPGPWYYVKDNKNRFSIYAKDVDGTIKPITGWGRITQNEANACLIAAAPELLEALEVLLAWANIQDHHSEQARQIRDKAGAAIAKANGEQCSNS